jgi:hypothetical protein
MFFNRLLRGRFDYESHGIMDNTHFRWYTFRSAKEMLESHGFDVLEAAATGSVPLRFVRKFMPRMSAKVDRFFVRLFPGLFGAQLIYVARPRRLAERSVG